MRHVGTSLSSLSPCRPCSQAEWTVVSGLASVHWNIVHATCQQFSEGRRPVDGCPDVPDWARRLRQQAGSRGRGAGCPARPVLALLRGRGRIAKVADGDRSIGVPRPMDTGSLVGRSYVLRRGRPLSVPRQGTGAASRRRTAPPGGRYDRRPPPSGRRSR